VTGATNGIEVKATDTLEWISPPVSADVTVSGTITVNIWAAESSASANVAINAVIEVIRANALGTANSNTLVQIAKTARTTEVALTTRAVNNFTVSATSTVVNRGDRLRVRVFGDDAGTMATGFTFNISYNGATAAADGDTYVTFTQTFAFESAPSGTQLFLTNDHSGMTAASALISNFTGADENPLSEGGNWAQLSSSGNALQRISNAVASVINGLGASYWTPANFGPDVEVYLTLTNVAVSGHGLAVRVQGEGGANTWDGYQARLTAAEVILSRVTDSVRTDLDSSISAGFAAGDKLGLSVRGSTITAWRQPSGSSRWNIVLTAVDATYASAGKIAVIAPWTTTRSDNFFAGTGSRSFSQKAWTSRGAGVVAPVASLAGWSAPTEIGEWFTPPLTASTLTGLAVANLRAKEAGSGVNASLRCEVARVDGDGANPTVWASWCIAPTGSDNGELTSSEVARTANVSGDDLAISDGQRLRIRVYVEDTSNVAAVFGATTLYYAGTSAAASGDSYVTLPVTVTEQAVPKKPRIVSTPVPVLRAALR
jgi:hypothetical protein